MQNPNSRIVALDIGAKRIGVATAHVLARLASPLTTVQVTDVVYDTLESLLAEQAACALVVGLPRGMQGQDTDQTRSVQEFVKGLEARLTIPVYWQDEALTSHLSEAELMDKKGSFRKEEVDALAATYILEDFLATHREELHV